MKKNISALLALFMLILCACGKAEQTEKPPVYIDEINEAEATAPAAVPPDAPAPDTEPEPGEEAETETPEVSDGPSQSTPVTQEEISALFTGAIENLSAEVCIDVSGMTWVFGAENDLKNIYYGVLAEHQELKYAYDMEASVSGDTAVCRFSYMPYKTGAYESALPAGSHTVASLHDAKVMAQSMIDGTECLSIAITEPSLLVEDIQLALGQAGYGWIRFDLSRDGTEIRAQAPVGKTLDECVSAINESFRLGEEILSSVVTAGMTETEKAKALYDYVVGSVSYDFRYYSDRAAMPYESTVALGAFRDNLAICGGYAQAFQTLLDMAGIENYTVSGVSAGEYHMWNYLVIDGEGYYCDPTADRGGMDRHFMLTAGELNELGGYSWNQDFLLRMAGT